MIKIFRHHPLQIVAIETDQAAQKIDRQKILAGLAFFFDDDLGQNRPRDILVRARVIDVEIDSLFHHRREIL